MKQDNRGRNKNSYLYFSVNRVEITKPSIQNIKESIPVELKPILGISIKIEPITKPNIE